MTGSFSFDDFCYTLDPKPRFGTKIEHNRSWHRLPQLLVKFMSEDRELASKVGRTQKGIKNDMNQSLALSYLKTLQLIDLSITARHWRNYQFDQLYNPNLGLTHIWLSITPPGYGDRQGVGETHPWSTDHPVPQGRFQRRSDQNKVQL